MRKNAGITSTVVSFALALLLISFLCPASAEAQADWGSSKQTTRPAASAFTPPPDQLIYLRPGPKESTVGVTAVNFNVPNIQANITYLKETYNALEELGYDVPDNPSQGAIQVRATVKFNRVDNSEKVANERGSRAVTGAILGALGGLAGGGGGSGAASGAAGGASGALSEGDSSSPVTNYLTIEFVMSSKKNAPQSGRITKDITNIDMSVQEAIDAIIADYLRAALPAKH